MSRFKACVNRSLGLPKPLYLFLSVLFFIQLIGPALTLGSPILWDSDSPISVLLQVIGFLWEGPIGSGRVLCSLICALVNFALYALQTVSLLSFRRTRIVPKGQQTVFLALSKYVKPLLQTIAVAGLPDAALALFDGDALGIFAFAIILLGTVLHFFDVRTTSARLLMENSALHEWYWHFPLLQTAVTQLSALFSATAAAVRSPAAAAPVCLHALTYATFGVYCLRESPTVKRQSAVLLASCCFACGGLSLIGLGCSLGGFRAGPLLFLFLALLFVVSALAVRAFDRRYVARVMTVFDRCEARPGESDAIMEDAWASAGAAIRALHVALERWPPFLITWKACHWMLDRWPDDVELAVTWTRIIAMFPAETELFRLMIDRYAKLPDHALRTAYIEQMIHLAASRITETTQDIERQLESLRRGTLRLRGLHTRFWKNLLQKSTSAFWDDAWAISDATHKVKIGFKHLMNASPNNFDVAIAYSRYMLECEGDTIGYLARIPKIARLDTGATTTQDFGLSAAADFLPEVRQLCGEIVRPASGEHRASGALNIDPDEQHLKVGCQTFIENTRAGSLGHGWLLLFVGVSICLGMTGLFGHEFKSYFVDELTLRLNLSEANERFFRTFAIASYEVLVLPFRYLPVSGLCEMYSLATGAPLAGPLPEWVPLLGPTGLLPPFNLNVSTVKVHIEHARQYYEAIAGVISDAGGKEFAQLAYDLLFVAKLEALGGATLHDFLMRLLVEMESVVDTLGDHVALDFRMRAPDGTDELASTKWAAEQLLWPMSRQYFFSDGFLAMTLFMHGMPVFVSDLCDRQRNQTYEAVNLHTQRLHRDLTLVIASAAVLVAAPFALLYYWLSTKGDAIVRAFTSLPGSSVREVLQTQLQLMGGARSSASTYDNETGQIEGEDQVIVLQQTAHATGRTVLMVFLFFLSFAAPLIGGVVLYFEYLQSMSSGVTLILQFIDVVEIPPLLYTAILEITWCMITQSLDGTTLPLTALPTTTPVPEPGAPPPPTPPPSETPQPTAPPKPEEGVFFQQFAFLPMDIRMLFHRALQFQTANETLTALHERMIAGFWGERDPLHSWNPQIHVDLLGVDSPLHNPETMSDAFTDLEKLLTLDLSLVPEAFTQQLWEWHAVLEGYRLPAAQLDQHPYYSGQLLYFATSVLNEFRLQPLIDEVSGVAREGTDHLSDFAQIVVVIVCIFEAIIMVVLIYFLLRMSSRMRHVLMLLMFFSPNTVLQNATVSTLLLTGTLPVLEGAVSFENAERVVEIVREGVLLCDRELIVRDFNDSCLKLLSLQAAALRGLPLSEALVAPEDSPGVENALAAIDDVIRGAEPRAFVDTFKIATTSGTRIVSMRSTHLTEMGMLGKGESVANIQAVLIQLADLTEQKAREGEIQHEVEKVTTMLHRIIPMQMVDQLTRRNEPISFAVQSASVGSIQVSFGSREPTLDDPFFGVHKLYILFDDWLAQFPQLTKVSVFAGEYIYAGGVFTAANKPEKHAEEATRFGLKVLSNMDEIVQIVGPGVSLGIGINTGGPLVGGIMNARRPLFQLLGTPVELARGLAETSVSGQLHVTRSVYEHVYSHNFKVTERGDTNLRGGKSVHSYLITL